MLFYLPAKERRTKTSHLPFRHQQQRVGRLDRLEVEGGLSRAQNGVAVERALDGDAVRFVVGVKEEREEVFLMRSRKREMKNEKRDDDSRKSRAELQSLLRLNELYF